ncbi:hypothetical protein TRAPUB_12303, partial [Trametes pubescens]
NYLPLTPPQASEHKPAPPTSHAPFASRSGFLYNISTIFVRLAALYCISKVWAIVSVPFFSCVAAVFDMQRPSWSLDSSPLPVESLGVVRHPSMCAPRCFSFDEATRRWDLVPVALVVKRRAQVASRPVLLILPPPPPLSLPPTPPLPPLTPPLLPPIPTLPPTTPLLPLPTPLLLPPTPLSPPTPALPPPTPSLSPPTPALLPPPSLPLPPPPPPLPPPEPLPELANKKKTHRGNRGGKRQQRRKLKRANAAEALAQPQLVADIPQDFAFITNGRGQVVIAHHPDAAPTHSPPPNAAPAPPPPPPRQTLPHPPLAPRPPTAPTKTIIGRTYSHCDTPPDIPAVTTFRRRSSPPQTLAIVTVRVLPTGKLNQRARRALTTQQTLGIFLIASSLRRRPP